MIESIQIREHSIERKKASINIIDIAIFACLIWELTFLLLTYIDADSYDIFFALFLNVFILFFLIIFDLFAMGISKHFTIFILFCCIFIFLLGRKFLLLLEYGHNADFMGFYTRFVKIVLNYEEYRIFTSLLFFSIFVTFVAYKFILSKNKNSRTVKQKHNYASIRKTAGFMTALTCIFAFAMQIIILFERKSSSYIESYLIQVNVPSIIRIFNYMFEGSVFLYLSTAPKKSKAYLALFMWFIVSGVMPAFSGNRFDLGIGFLMVVWYLIRYHKLDKRKQGLKFFLKLMLIGVVALVVFFVMEQMRGDKELAFISIFSVFENMLDSLGGSDSVIAAIIRYADAFPKSGYVYFFDPLKSAFVDNVVTRTIIGIFSGTSIVTYPQGMERLAHRDEFAHWLTYLCAPSYYLEGQGMGSSYIAETYFAFGIFGIIIFSFVFGYFIAKMNNVSLRKDGAIKNAVVMFFTCNLFLLPRGSVFASSQSLMYFLFTLLICWILSKSFFHQTQKNIKG